MTDDYTDEVRAARNDLKRALTGQLTRDDMTRMTPEQITQAHEEGKFADITGASVPVDLGRLPEQLSAAHLAALTPEQIDQAHREGRLDNLMNGA